VEREKSVGGGYENSCHEFRSSRTGHHPKKSHRNFDVVLPCSEATSKTADGARREWRVLNAASSGGSSGFSEMNLASTSPSEVLDCKLASSQMQLDGTNFHRLVAFRTGGIDE
jgi:hypothetical protein